jgi:hypothetical protein
MVPLKGAIDSYFSFTRRKVRREFSFYSFSLRGLKEINFSPYGQEKLYIICRRHAGFHLPASQAANEK